MSKVVVELTAEPCTVPLAVAPPVTLTFPVTAGKVCPLAKVITPLLAICSPVAAGVLVPDPYNRLNAPLGAALPLPTGTVSTWNVCATAALVPLLNDEATKSRGSELVPAVAVAVPVAGRLSAP